MGSKRKTHLPIKLHRSRTKKCCACGRRLPLESFEFTWATTDHMQPMCLDCQYDPPVETMTLTRRYTKQGETHE